MYKLLFLLFCSSILFSCTITKRQYRRGWNVQWHSNYKSDRVKKEPSEKTAVQDILVAECIPDSVDLLKEELTVIDVSIPDESEEINESQKTLIAAFEVYSIEEMSDDTPTVAEGLRDVQYVGEADEFINSQQSKLKASKGDPEVRRKFRTPIILAMIAVTAGLIGWMLLSYGNVFGYLGYQIFGVVFLFGAGAVALVTLIFLLVLAVYFNEKRIKKKSNAE